MLGRKTKNDDDLVKELKGIRRRCWNSVRRKSERNQFETTSHSKEG